MSKTFSVLYLIVMIALIVGIDIAFLRDDAGLRLVVNIAIVAAFGVGYFLLMRRARPH